MVKTSKKPFGKKDESKKKVAVKKPKAVRKTPPERTRGLGRGLSALMADVAPIPTDLETKSAKTSPPIDTQDEDVSPEEAAFHARQTALRAKREERAEKAGRDMGASEEDLAEAREHRASTPKNQPATYIPPAKGVTYIAIDKIDRNHDQPRRHFALDPMRELVLSIKDKGVLQPILVRPIPNGAAKDKEFADVDLNPEYQIVAGERRWRAALEAGLDAMPVFIRDLSDVDVLEIGVVENIQREDLNPVDEARAYLALQSQFGRTQAEIAEAIGKSRSYVANMLRILNLPENALRYLSDELITLGHARAIIAAPDPTALAEAIIENRMTVREAEDWVRRIKNAESHIRPLPIQKDADIRALEKELTSHLGLNVDIKHKNPGGELRVKYKTGDQLEDVLKRLRG